MWRGLWEFNVMPFRLTNSRAPFERLMERVLKGIPAAECEVYLDDILVHAPCFNKALANLRLEVRSFMGLVSCYRSFITNFASNEAPLYTLTEKSIVFRSPSVCQRVIKRILTALVTAPILTMVDSTKPFILDPDASNVGIGAILS
ncbi:hypothetical protein SKAU_G00262340 [Synaphobranchus kaupii]|uniref:Reverse transcriptase/retrotransposon-derived protein RNase H-like domain-containing protein n=1 Tax=Synaphobranchus kaupii TaxID=118154 RepID=A0A9Q1EYV0_SYNKA|nr:hypothetical protein SKAU_G00262340 [Synaphobranchus kaupii]